MAPFPSFIKFTPRMGVPALYFSSAASPSPAQGNTEHKSMSAPPPPLPRSPPSGVGITNTKAATIRASKWARRRWPGPIPRHGPHIEAAVPESITGPNTEKEEEPLTCGRLGWRGWCSPLLGGCLCTERHRRVLENQPSVARPSCNPQRHPPGRSRSLPPPAHRLAIFCLFGEKTVITVDSEANSPNGAATGMWEGGRRPRERSPIAFIRLNGHRRTHRTHLSPRDWHRSSRELETIQEEGMLCLDGADHTQIFRFCRADAPREEAAAVVRCPIWRDTITSRYLCHLRCWTCIPGRSLPLKLLPSPPHLLCLRPPPHPPHPLHHPHHTLSMYARIIPAWHAPPECGVFVISHRGADILQAGAHREQHGLSASSRGTTTTSPNGAGNDILHPFHASRLPRSI